MSTKAGEVQKDDISSESEGKPTGSSNAIGEQKRRQSRAGTRSVNTLSAAQLERKRANDREAQRAIRQRTKEHIDNLERRIVELSGGPDSGELARVLKENKELREENNYLRAKLSQANLSLGIPDSSSQAPSWDDVTTASPLSSDGMQILSQPTSASPIGNPTTSNFPRTGVQQFQPAPPWTADHFARGSFEKGTPRQQQLGHDLPSDQWKIQRGSLGSNAGEAAGYQPGTQSSEYPYMMTSAPQFPNHQQNMSVPFAAQNARDTQMRNPTLSQQNIGPYNLPSQPNHIQHPQNQRGNERDPPNYHPRTQGGGDGSGMYGR